MNTSPRFTTLQTNNQNYVASPTFAACFALKAPRPLASKFSLRTGGGSPLRAIGRLSGNRAPALHRLGRVEWSGVETDACLRCLLMNQVEHFLEQ